MPQQEGAQPSSGETIPKEGKTFAQMLYGEGVESMSREENATRGFQAFQDALIEMSKDKEIDEDNQNPIYIWDNFVLPQLHKNECIPSLVIDDMATTTTDGIPPEVMNLLNTFYTYREENRKRNAAEATQ